jgi:hypothetical protein
MQHLYRVHFACSSEDAEAVQVALDKVAPGWIGLIQKEGTPEVFVASGQYTLEEFSLLEPLLGALAALVWVRGDALGVPLSAKEGEVVVDKDQELPRNTPASKLRYTLDYAVKAATDGTQKAEPTDTSGVVR